MRTTVSWVSKATRISCPRQMMARLPTSNRGNKRSKDNNRSVKRIKRRAMSQINNLSMRKTKIPTKRVAEKMASNRMKVVNLCQPRNPICRKEVTTSIELLMMIESRRLVKTRGCRGIKPPKTHR